MQLTFEPTKQRPSRRGPQGYDGVLLRPGANELSEAQWRRLQANAAAQADIANGAIVLSDADLVAVLVPEEDELPTVIEAPIALAGVPSGLDAAAVRLAELKALYEAEGWRAIKAIGDGLGLARPADGWDAALLPIIEAEYSSEIAAALATADAGGEA